MAQRGKGMGGGQGKGQQGPSGRGKGMGGGQGRGQQGASDRGKGMGGGRGLGSGGDCVCPDCGHKAPHERGTPCFEIKCPNCGSYMTRE